MITSEIAYKYANALFLSSSPEERESHLKQLKLLVQVLDKPELMTFFISPQISFSDKMRVLQKVLKQHLDHELFSFLSLLLAKGRFKHFSEMMREFGRLYNESQGVLRVRLITTVPVDDAVLAKLKKRLDDKYRKNIKIKNDIDPKLVGGGILVIGNQMIDFSIRNKLKRLKEELLSINV